MNDQSVTLYCCDVCGKRSTAPDEPHFHDAFKAARSKCPGEVVPRVFVPAAVPPAGTGGAVGESRVEYREVKPDGTVVALYSEGSIVEDVMAVPRGSNRVERRTVSSGPWTTEGDKP